jgi:hypothetical protein
LSEKKVDVFFPARKAGDEPRGMVEGGSPFLNFFSIVEKTGNLQMLASWYKTYIRRFGEDAKKKGIKKSERNHRR